MKRHCTKLAFAVLLPLGCGGTDVANPPGAAMTTEPPVSPGTPGEPDAASAPDSGIEAGPGPATTFADPTKAGPYQVAELDTTTKVAATGDDLPIHCAHPTGASGPFPVVVFAHGFQIASSQYYGYVRRLASFGYVALTADYPASFTSVSNVRDAKNLSGALDWAASAPELGGRAAPSKSGVMGHSRGGKAAVLAAAADPRFVAVLALDPVDSKPPLGCDAKTECPDSRDALGSRAIPSAFLGETLDATAGGFGQACAPADGNYATYHPKAKSPSFEITVNGASHMSFIEDRASCGFACSACKMATVDDATVLGLAYAVSVSFFERFVRNDARYQTYVDGAEAQARWIGPGLTKVRTR